MFEVFFRMIYRHLWFVYYRWLHRTMSRWPG